MDYPLQADFMAQAKNHLSPKPGVPWFLILISHAFMHAFGVYLITTNLVCFLFELISHTLIDYFKCNKNISFGVDQGLHLFIKMIIVIYITFT